MQPAGSVRTSLVDEHLGIIYVYVKFGQNPISGFRGQGVYVKTLMDDARRWTAAIGRPQLLTLSTLLEPGFFND